MSNTKYKSLLLILGQIDLHFYPFFQELHSQFKKVLTPLVVKNIQSEDPSVMLVLKAFNDLCQNPELPLQKVAYQIEQDLATVTLGMQVRYIRFLWGTPAILGVHTKYHSDTSTKDIQ